MATGNFAYRAMRYHRQLKCDVRLPRGITAMNPFTEGQALKTSDAFLRRYFDDSHKRVAVMGINPGRLGAGLTGVAFTDPLALQRFCGIVNSLPQKRELSSTFIYDMIGAMGGPKRFYGSFYLGATYPLGFLDADGNNINFYDDPKLLAATRPAIVRAVRAQVEFGCRTDVAIVLGTGKLKSFWEKLNEEERFFGHIIYLEHPRFILQYKRKKVGEYIEKYRRALATAKAG